MRSNTLLLLLAFGLTLLLARMDQDVTSWASLVRWENVPALVIYTVIFRLLLAAVAFTVRAIVGTAPRSHSR